MSDYNKSTNFTAKDTLPSGNSGKIVKGTEIDIEFTNIASAIASKANSDSPALTGTPTTPTAIPESNSTQIASTAFVKTAIAASGGGFGTMATQNANAVAITGGTITGSYGLTAANATNATNATNSTYASNPASGGSFITSSNIGSQSVNYANSAGNGGVTSIVAGTNITISSSTGAVTINSTASGGSIPAMGAVGSLGFFQLNYAVASVNNGDYVSGSNLQWGGVRQASSGDCVITGGGTPSGTWLALGQTSRESTGESTCATLFIRTA